MLINTTHDHALRMCCYLMASEGGRASSADIAEATGSPRMYLIQLAQRLRNAGIIEAQSGRYGGYSLAKDADKISVLDVMRAVDETTETEHLSSEAKYVKRQVLDTLECLSLTEVM